jgi:hypothetical protein
MINDKDELNQLITKIADFWGRSFKSLGLVCAVKPCMGTRMLIIIMLPVPYGWLSIRLISPKSLSDILESVQKRALRIAYPDLLYDEALEISNLQYMSTRRDISCKKFVESLRRDVSPYNPLTKIMEIRPGVKTHDYDLRNDRMVKQSLWPETTEWLKNFVTRKYY